MVLSENARRVLEARYLKRGASGEIVETPEEMFHRVAHSVAEGETAHAGRIAKETWEEAFFKAMSQLEFLPNSPTLMNAGTRLGQLSACFVLPVEDSLASIFEAVGLMARIQQSGGGTGFSFSHLRPNGDLVASTGGPASGPVSFMRVFDSATQSVQQGGRRRGANMGVLRVDHPDIVEFVEAKADGKSLSNFNLSVGVTDDFMQRALADEPFVLRNPRTGRAAAELRAKELFVRIAKAAWATGDPGLLFLDAIRRKNPLAELGEIEATNPCGEVPLLPFEACTLGSIALARMLREEASGLRIDWDKLERITRLGVRFLDDVIEVNRYPDPRIDAAVKATRKIGLGVMGFAELLIRLGVPYASPRAFSLAEEVMGFVSERARLASEQLARERGVFPRWDRSVHAREGRRVRNATQSSIAPTGTISILAGTSASIEPLFALAFRRRALEGETLVELNPLLMREIDALGLPSAHGTERVARELADKGTLTGVKGIPTRLKELFQSALEIAPEDHLRIQLAFQRKVDNAVSKTVNLPESAAWEDVATIYRRAFELGLKGVTIYRYGSKASQVLTLGAGESAFEHEHFARCDPHGCKM